MTKKTGSRALQMALGGVVAAGLVSLGTSADAKPTWKGHEKCYGVSKAGMNDCGSAAHACAGKATADEDPGEWIYLPTGTCEKLAGGSLEPKKK